MVGCGKGRHEIEVISLGYCYSRGLITETSGRNCTFCVYKTFLLNPRRSHDINTVSDCPADPMQLRVLLSPSGNIRGVIKTISALLLFHLSHSLCSTLELAAEACVSHMYCGLEGRKGVGRSKETYIT
jgi:hypothetical protein